MNENKDVVKKRLMTLLNLLYENTDEEHPMETQEIIDYLAEHNVPANRKTLKSDIDVLENAGLDIVTVSSKPNKYFWGDRTFELPEVKLLIDAVSSSRFITQKKSQELTKKLATFASKYQQSELNRHIYATNRVKSANEQIYYTVDTVNQAITRRKKIAFKYLEYDVNKEKTFRNDGEIYELSPYALFWNEDFYYVVGWSDKHGNISVFRVDRLYKPEITEHEAVRKPADFNLEDYSKQIFEMYDGEEVLVRLECRGDLMKYIIDRFGEDVSTVRLTDDLFLANVTVSLSPTFYAWVFTFGGAIRIMAPERAVREITGMAQGLLDREPKLD
jgi:predicted DNA-binding transcriptional regulator YafY